MRLTFCSLLCCLLLLLQSAEDLHAQQSERRCEPSILTTGYYVVDSNDPAPAPWRPTYFFQDTSYNRSEWTQIATGPGQHAQVGHYFFNPSQPDSINDAMAGPIYMRLARPWNFYSANYDSVYISSNGFIGFRPYTEAISGTTPMYCNGNAVDLKNNASSAPRAIIAALWGDLDMRHGGKLDTSLVYYRTSATRDTFFVNYYNFRLRNASPNSFSPPGFSAGGSDRIFIKKFQIVLANSDSSIQINYGPFSGSVNYFPPVLAARLFDNNCSIGLVSETQAGGMVQSTSVLYGGKFGVPRWDAINSHCLNCNKELEQVGRWSLKFRRWHNVVRAAQVSYPPRNFELCLGTSLTPKARFTNVDSVLHYSIVARFLIRNVVTGLAVYNRSVILRDVPPGAFVDTMFPPYLTNPNVQSEIGTFNGCAIATTYDSSGANIGDEWPFDDTVCTRIFGMRRLAIPFRDASNNYSTSVTGNFPDQTLWVSLGASVVDGENATWDPPPPRDLDGSGYGPNGMRSPVIRLDRSDAFGNIYAGTNTGDTLTSFPINLRAHQAANFTFDYMRSGRQYYPWLWDENTMLGPEHTVIDRIGHVVRVGDSLVLEFKQPNEPGCNPSPAAWDEIAAIDGGRDFEFKQYYLALQNLSKNYFTPDFRFRFRLKGNYNGPNPPSPVDDDDPWYIDNPTLSLDRKPELEVVWVRVVNPYSKIPASRADALPIYVEVKNSSTKAAISFPIEVQIQGPSGNLYYSKRIVAGSLDGGRDSAFRLPDWNAQAAIYETSGPFIVKARLAQDGYDSYGDDDSTYTKFYLNVENTPDAVPELAYDDAGVTPAPGGGNDIPQILQFPGAGIGFVNSTGSFAAKFKLTAKDILYGVRVYFANANQAPDAIRLSLMYGSPNSCLPGDTVYQQGVQSTFQDVRRGGYFNQYWPYYFPKPIILPGEANGGANKGMYWIGVSQLSIENMCLGGDVSRGGGYIRVADNVSPQILPIYSSPFGTQWGSGPADNNGDVSCVWAFEIPAGSGNWSPLMPAIGQWPVMNSTYNTVTPQTRINLNSDIWAGSYTPMIRPLLSNTPHVPVEFVYFIGHSKDGAAQLTWATSRERENAGFFVERRPLPATSEAGSEEFFEKIGFVAAKQPSSSTETGYGFIDLDLTPGDYVYRLIQEDMSGEEKASSEIAITIEAPKSFSLAANYPNPFTSSSGTTSISYSLPDAGAATLAIYNQLGEAVRTWVSGNDGAGSHVIRWDGKDDNGKDAGAGTYLCKLTAGERTATIKIAVIR